MSDPHPARIEAGWLAAPPVRALFSLLDADGEQAKIVGGAVRNTLLGEPPGDLDFATTAVPEEVMRRAAAAGVKAVPTGVEHGTVTLVIGGHGHEVTTLRRDVETDGRRAQVAFGRDWRADAARRDFTMNALYLEADGTVFDPLGGHADLMARRVRFIGDPDARIAEDALRILRFFRFSAAYGRGAIDPAGLSACIAARGLLGLLSRERVRQELVKLLVARDALPAVEAMAEAGLLDRLIAGVPYLAPLARLIALEAELGVAPCAMRRLAALATRVTEDGERLAERLRLSKAERELLCALAPVRRDVLPTLDETARRILVYRAGGRAGDLVLLAWARGRIGEGWRALYDFADGWTAPAMPFKGADLLALGAEKGPAVGAALARFEAWWMARGFPYEAGLLHDGLVAAARETGALPPNAAG